jgi:hypothetical protein
MRLPPHSLALLRASRERSHHGRAPEERNELPPLYSVPYYSRGDIETTSSQRRAHQLTA